MKLSPWQVAGMFALAGCLGSLSAAAETQEDALRLAAIQQQTAQLKTLSAEFTSTKHVSFLRKPMITRGRLLFEKPNLISWEITAPFKAAVVYDGRTASRFLPDAQGRWRRQGDAPDPVLAETMRQLQNWLSGQAFAAQHAYEISTEAGPPVCVHMTPKHAGLRKFVARMDMTFGERLDVVQTLVLTEGSGDSTHIAFSKIVVNEPLPDLVSEPRPGGEAPQPK